MNSTLCLVLIRALMGQHWQDNIFLIRYFILKKKEGAKNFLMCMSLACSYGSIMGVRYLMERTLKVFMGLVFNFRLVSLTLKLCNCMACKQPRLEMNSPRVRPWSILSVPNVAYILITKQEFFYHFIQNSKNNQNLTAGTLKDSFVPIHQPEQRAVSMVQSTLAITTSFSSFSLYFTAKSCHVGASLLQCPHLSNENLIMWQLL